MGGRQTRRAESVFVGDGLKYANVDAGIRVDRGAVDQAVDGLKNTFKGANLGQILGFLKRTTRDELDKAFVSASTPYGKPWAPRLAPYPWRPLQRTGTLRNLLEIGGNTGTSGGHIFVAVREASMTGTRRATRRQDRTRAGSPVSSFLVANAVFRGVKKGPRQMPGRSPLGLSRAARKRFKRFVDGLVDKVT